MARPHTPPRFHLDISCGVPTTTAAGAGSDVGGSLQQYDFQLDLIIISKLHQRLKLKHDKLPSRFAFKFNLRHYTTYLCVIPQEENILFAGESPGLGFRPSLKVTLVNLSAQRKRF